MNFCKLAQTLVGAMSIFIGASAHGQILSYTTLHTFTGTPDGLNARGLVIVGDTLYGTTGGGGMTSGINGAGTVFSVNTNGSGYTILYAFPSISSSGPQTNSDGSNPSPGGLLISGNTLYGTTEAGGGVNGGTVFSITTNGVFSVLYTFTNITTPQGGLVLSGNTLYGTSTSGGTNGHGAVFSVNTDGTGFTILHSFPSSSPNYPYSNTDGLEPYAGLVLSDGILYGTTMDGGSGGSGVVFSLSTNGTGFTTLHSFAPVSAPLPNAGGANPQAALVLAGSTLYGTTYWGGTNGYGTVFAVNTDGSSFTILHNFTSVESESGNPLTLSGTNLYGATGAVIFSMNLDGTAFTVLDALGGASGSIAISSNIIYGISHSPVTTEQTLFALPISSIPVIGTQPQPLVVTAGYPASFTVTAFGSLPLSYQWAFNYANIGGATNATFALANVFSTNTGTYTVTITNVFGSTNSAPATLTVAPIPFFSPAISANGEFQFSFGTVSNANYMIEISTTLRNWIPVLTVGGFGGPITIIDPNSGPIGQRFYRVNVVQP
jgi:uncharacterized repeat protein (TIGR03803 family)